jgi:hypothetical protein
MAAMLFVILSFTRGLRRSLADPEFRVIGLMVLLLLGLGTAFYSNVEGWTVLDSLYFSLITLTTVGYGDLAPRTAAGKIFTMVYILMGLGVIVTFAHRIARGAGLGLSEVDHADESDERDRGRHPHATASPLVTDGDHQRSDDLPDPSTTASHGDSSGPDAR